MLNQLVVVGRLTKNPEVIEIENGKRVSNIAIAVPRNFKNEKGEYDTDFIEVTMWNNIAENAEKVILLELKVESKLIITKKMEKENLFKKLLLKK